MRRTNIFNYVQKSILVVVLAFSSQVIFAQYLKYDEKKADEFLGKRLSDITKVYPANTESLDKQCYNKAKALRMVANNEAISKKTENNTSKAKQIVDMAFNYAIDCSPENLSNLFAQVVGVNPPCRMFR